MASLTDILVRMLKAFSVVKGGSPPTPSLRKPLFAETYPGNVWQI
jgi:hypothetical protein